MTKLGQTKVDTGNDEKEFIKIFKIERRKYK